MKVTRYSYFHHEIYEPEAAMRHKGLGQTACPVARALDHVGEPWSILILRDALHGLTRFDQFAESLGIAPNMLTRRLRALVASGLLERRAYSQHPPRYEYLLTERGREFAPVLWALVGWVNQHFAPEGASALIVDDATGAAADPLLVDRHTGRPLDDRSFGLGPGPAATERLRQRYAFAAERRAQRRAQPSTPNAEVSHE
jgi:DNA-binding HxlR family transcriptional regulator